MQLTTAQLATLKVWLLTNAGSLNDQQAADALNATASPDFRVYRSGVPLREVMRNGFDWTRVDNLSVGKARIWEWMKDAYQASGAPALAPYDPDCRAGINAVWVGTAADLAVRAAIYAHCWRRASVAEKLLATGAGGLPAQDGSGPATMGAEGTVTAQNVIDAYNA